MVAGRPKGRRYPRATAAVLVGAVLGAGQAAAADASGRDLPAWSIRLDQSELRFSGDSIIGEVTGGFRQFGGTIRFDPEEPTRARVGVGIATASLYASPDRATEPLKDKPFFATQQYPRAVIEARDIAPRTPDDPAAVPAGATAYRLTADVTIRATTETVTVPVTLRIDGDTAHARGRTTLNRLAFGIGDGIWSPAWLVSHEVQVAFKIVAQREAD